MGRECTVCNRTLITGRKYCYQHRRPKDRDETSEGEGGESGDGGIIGMVLFIGAILLLIGLMIYGLVYWTSLALSWIWQNLYQLIGVSFVAGGWITIGYFTLRLGESHLGGRKNESL